MLPVFDEELKRLALLQMPLKPVSFYKSIRVYRNHSFEITASVLNVFLNLSEVAADISYSDYDDSLNFQFQEADIQILWLDTERYKTADLSAFLQERLQVLRSLTAAPILLVYLGKEEIQISENIRDCVVVNLQQKLASLGDKAFDAAKEAYSGTRLSGQGSLEAARILGLQYIPALLQPSLKAIVVDLDNTLYNGILGEDGIKNLKPFNKLQQFLKTLQKQGIMLCVASKNEEEDARRLFAERRDFILDWNDFTAVAVNWQPKAENIRKLLEKMNIGADAALFIDDNPAEIENVLASGLPVKTILAENEASCLNQLNYFPGLLKLSVTREDTLRSADIKANAERVKLAQTLSPEEYFRKLEIKLTFGVNRPEQQPRIAELLGKTNQFILTYARYKQSEVQTFMEAEDSCIITAAMSDRLSDSGIIAILVAARGSEYRLELKELTVSCRALGRNLENIMIPQMFLLAAQKLKTTEEILINYRHGERNSPAMKWLEDFVNIKLSDSGNIIYKLPLSVKTAGLMIEVI